MFHIERLTRTHMVLYFHNPSFFPHCRRYWPNTIALIIYVKRFIALRDVLLFICIHFYTNIFFP